MQLLILIAAALLILFLWGEQTIWLLLRFFGVLLATWIALLFHRELAGALPQIPFFPAHEGLAVVAAFGVILIAFGAFFRWLLRGHRGVKTKRPHALALAAGLDSAPYALIALALVSFLGLLLGKIVGIPLNWVAVFAAIAAAMMTLNPDFFSRWLVSLGKSERS